tara:strand:+ start:235 stop:783 length:549 start_codon:yes stop_codon:yes gene_type:complete
MSQIKVNSIIPVAGVPTGGGGGITQIKQTVKKDVFSTSLAEGVVSGDITGLSVTITPTSATNKILLIPTVTLSAFAGFMYLYKDGSLISDAIGDASSVSGVARVTYGASLSIFNGSTGQQGMYLDTAGGTSAITYSIRVSTNSTGTQNVFVNRASDDESSPVLASTKFARYISTFTVMEVSA